MAGYDPCFSQHCCLTYLECYIIHNIGMFEVLVTALTVKCTRSFGWYFILWHSLLQLLTNAEDHLGDYISFCATVHWDYWTMQKIIWVVICHSVPWFTYTGNRKTLNPENCHNHTEEKKSKFCSMTMHLWMTQPFEDTSKSNCSRTQNQFVAGLYHLQESSLNINTLTMRLKDLTGT